MKIVDSLRNNLLNIMRQISGAAIELSTAVEQLSSVANQSKVNIEQQQKDTSRVANEMIEMTTAAKNNV